MNWHIKCGNNLYRLSRAVTRELYYLQKDIYCKVDFDSKWKALGKDVKSNRAAMLDYRARWKWSHAHLLSKNFYNACAYFSGMHHRDLMPPNVYLHSVEPVLNNKLMTEAYAEKGSYDKWLDKALLPYTIIRNVNGRLMDSDGQIIRDAQMHLQHHQGNFRKIIVKPTTDSWGGKNVLVFEEKDGEHINVETGNVLDYNWLVNNYKANFIVQEFIEQHPFYKRFNPTSFNTFRVYTYKSVSDNQIHVLHVVLRVGKEGSQVDNISSGGTACGVKQDGKLRNFGLTKELERIAYLPLLPELKLSEVGKLHMIDEVKQEAIKIAEHLPFNRIVGMDMGVDVNNKVRLIEINTDNIGVADSQFVHGPFFREFTDEVIDFCKRTKKVDVIKIY